MILRCTGSISSKYAHPCLQKFWVATALSSRPQNMNTNQCVASQGIYVLAVNIQCLHEIIFCLCSSVLLPHIILVRRNFSDKVFFIFYNSSACRPVPASHSELCLQVSSLTGAGWRSAALSRPRWWWSACASCQRHPGSCCPRARGGRQRRRCASCEAWTPPSNWSVRASKTPAKNRWVWPFRWKGRRLQGCLTACVVSVFSQGSRFQIADLKDPGVYKPLVIGFMLMVFQQMTGINAIMFYAQNIFEQAHFKVNTAFHSMTITIFVWCKDGCYHIRTFFPALGYRTFCFAWLK